jgi:glycosyltransferase involved in cell wall biosynthesis
LAIATVGRFWVLDLARELAALGHQVAFWSSVTRSTAASFGLPADAHRSLLPRLLPLLALRRFGGPVLSPFANRQVIVQTDRLIASRLEPCDVFIGMSGVAVESARVARTRYGARVFIERGSRHVSSQKAILDDLRNRGMAGETVPDWVVERELAGYALADRIVVPSLHVEQSFLDLGFPADKLFRNPYGVDLSMFAPTPAPTGVPPTMLFVGAWSYRKGVDVLVAAWRQLEGVRLLHVGAVVDAPLPDGPGFTHVEAVPQSRLRDYYAQAHLFVMASREEGLALVQAQALACGLPLVCTDRTGGEDLQRMLDDLAWVSVVPSDDAGALAAAIRAMLPRALDSNRDGVLGPARQRLGWAAYGARYAQELARVTHG